MARRRTTTTIICYAPEGCSYMFEPVNGGVHQYENGECIVCGEEEDGG